MPTLTDTEILATVDDWRAWGHQFGWTLTGVGDPTRDERGSAGFYRGESGPKAPWGHMFTITREMRDDIDNRK